MRVFLKAPIGAFTGYGRDGIGIAQALVKMGHDVTLAPTSCAPPLPTTVAALLTKYPEKPTDLAIHHISPDQLGITDEQNNQSHLSVGWSMWEFFGFGPTRLPAITERLSNYRHVFAYDETTLAAFKEARPEKPMSILQGGYSPKFWLSEALRDWYSDELRLCMVGALGPRKDPYVAAEAVSELREEGLNVTLTMKAAMPCEIHPLFDEVYASKGVKVIRETWTDSQIKKLYENSHVYLSTSWGEGKNLPALEAGTTGCALILSDVGGHRQWATKDYAILVGGQLAAHEEGMTSLRVDKELLKDAIRTVYGDRARLRRMGEQAKMQLPPSMSWEAVMHRLFARLDSI